MGKSISLNELTSVVRDSLLPGNYYTKKTLIQGLEDKKWEVSSTSVGHVLQKLRKEKFISYDSDSRFWIVDSREYDKLMKKKELEKEKIDMLSDPEMHIVKAFQKVVDQMAKDAVKHNIQTEHHDLIIKAVQEKVANEFRVEIKPAIIRMISDKVIHETDEKMGDIKEFINDTRSIKKQIRLVFAKLRFMEKVFKGIGILTKPLLKSGK